MRYLKSPLDVRREYVQTQKSFLKPIAYGRKWNFVSQYMFWGWGISI